MYIVISQIALGFLIFFSWQKSSANNSPYDNEERMVCYFMIESKFSRVSNYRVTCDAHIFLSYQVIMDSNLKHDKKL